MPVQAAEQYSSSDDSIILSGGKKNLFPLYMVVYTSFPGGIGHSSKRRQVHIFATVPRSQVVAVIGSVHVVSMELGRAEVF